MIIRSIGLGLMVVCASPAYLAEHGAPATPTDLAGHNCLLSVGASIDHRWHFIGSGGEDDVAVKGNLRTRSLR
jgi:DNA-binding transcriptional LysR family regulator